MFLIMSGQKDYGQELFVLKNQTDGSSQDEEEHPDQNPPRSLKNCQKPAD